MTVGELAQRMTEREFVRWQHYAARKSLSTRRMEIQVALLSTVMSRAHDMKHADGTPLGFSDFLRIEAKPVKKQEMTAAAVGAIAGSRLRKLGQKRVR